MGAAGEFGKGVKPSEVAAVMAAAAIEEIRKTPKRASSQLAKFNDVDSMQKSKKRVAWKSLDFSGGNSSALSFIHFPTVFFTLIHFSTVDIASSVSNLGVSLGSNSSMVADSVCLLKEKETVRIRPETSSTEV